MGNPSLPEVVGRGWGGEDKAALRSVPGRESWEQRSARGLVPRMAIGLWLLGSGLGEVCREGKDWPPGHSDFLTQACLGTALRGMGKSWVRHKEPKRGGGDHVRPELGVQGEGIGMIMS